MTRAKAAPAKKKAPPPKTKPAAKAAAPAESPGSTTHRVDWEAVKRDFRTSRFTNVELCRKHSLDPATLSRRIKRDREKDPAAWPQDLSKAVKAATDARLMQELVKAEVKEGQQAVKLTVQAAAEVNAQVILAHRNRVRRATDVAMRMLDELDATTLDADKLEELFKAATAEMAGPAFNAARARFGELMRLHNRVASAQKLMAALGEAQKLEAQTFNLYGNNKDEAGELENLTDDELDAAIREKQAKLGAAT